MSGWTQAYESTEVLEQATQSQAQKSNKGNSIVEKVLIGKNLTWSQPGTHFDSILKSYHLLRFKSPWHGILPYYN